MIVDCRRANACHRAPPCTRLSSAFSIGDLDLSGASLHGSGFGEIRPVKIEGSASDVNDCFYQFSLREAGAWFGIRQSVDAASWGVTHVFDDALGRRRPVRPGEQLFPVFEAIPMGWSFALHFVHEAVANLVSTS